MKQINTTVSAQFKAVCRKTLLASALICGFYDGKMRRHKMVVISLLMALLPRRCGWL